MQQANCGILLRNQILTCNANPVSKPRQNVVVYARMQSAAVVEWHTPPRTMLVKTKNVNEANRLKATDGREVMKCESDKV